MKREGEKREMELFDLYEDYTMDSILVICVPFSIIMDRLNFSTLE
ncbi:hypothetical protein J2TS4_15550 [Paenibacillus sp. J2TS4]|nr:hypothetical protein J2TS4_15550 [Paenibacillus sp. J2TS4]